jgi:hypothetical protein
MEPVPVVKNPDRFHLPSIRPVYEPYRTTWDEIAQVYYRDIHFFLVEKPGLMFKNIYMLIKVRKTILRIPRILIFQQLNLVLLVLFLLKMMNH